MLPSVHRCAADERDGRTDERRRVGRGRRDVDDRGVAVIALLIEAVLVAPSESVMLAVMVWPPSVRRTSRLAPVPSVPSRLDVHEMRLEASPSKSSMALAVRTMRVPASFAVPLAGAVMRSTGATFSSRMRMVTEAWPSWPSASVTAAVRTCMPRVSADAGMLAPVPSAPSRLDDQRMLRAMSPSSKSLAVPVSMMGRSRRKRTELCAGATIATCGVRPTWTVVVDWPVRPWPSVTRAVMVCTPARRVEMVRAAPLPKAPSRLELH